MMQLTTQQHGEEYYKELGKYLEISVPGHNSASDCLERLVSEMIYYVSRGTLNSTHSLTVFGQ